jgi:hypothetical protein
MTLEFCITTIAIIAGPLAAVLISRHLQDRSEKRSRQMQVYRSLMATRRSPLSPQRVEALNLIDVEFAKSHQTIFEFKKLVDLYNDTARWKSNDRDVRTQILQEVNDKTADMLNEMGKALGFNFESLELLRGGYAPEAFADIEDQQYQAREFLASLNRGTRAVPVIVVPATPKSGEEE